MSLQLFMQSFLYLIFIPAFVANLLILMPFLKKSITNNSRKSRYLLNSTTMLIDVTTLLLTFSQITLAYIMLILHSDFEIVMSTAAPWMSNSERIAASWTNRWGSYHLWTWFTWVSLSVFIHVFKLKSNESLSQTLLFHRINITGSVIILFLLMGQRPYRLAETLEYLGSNPTLLSFWNLTHPPLAFASYTGFYISWVIGSTLWINQEENKFSETIIKIDRVVTKITWLFTSLVLVFGMLWSHEANWGGYWDWDAVQVLAVVLWLISAYKLHISSKGRNRPMYLLLSMFGFTIVFLAAWIITSNVLSGLHNYAGSPVAPLFLFLTLLTLLPIVYGYIKHRPSVRSPVNTHEDIMRPTGFNMGILSFNGLILGNLLIIFLQILMSILEYDIDYGLVFPYLNGIGFTTILIGITVSKKLNDQINMKVFSLVILVAVMLTIIYWVLPIASISVQNLIKGLLIFITYTTILTIFYDIFQNRFKKSAKNFSHLAMAFVFLIVIANGAGPSISEREVIALNLEDTYTLAKNGYIVEIIEIQERLSTDRGFETIVMLSLTLENSQEDISLSIIEQNGYPPYIQAEWFNIGFGVEIFFNLQPGDPLRYFGPNVIGVNLIIEYYYLTTSIWIGTLSFFAIPVINLIIAVQKK